jgi:ubiquinone/menaquinone biosynthesis C-methylase UbiE
MPVLLRETLGPRRLPREPEPTLVMEDAEQVSSYVEAGRIDGVMASAYLLHSARISQVIQGARRVVDLACGPATQLAQIAALHPDIEFHGIDLSKQMLAAGRDHIATLGLRNVRFARGDVTRLDMPEGGVDAVISTMALHHLPTLDHLRQCFKEIRRILRPGGALYLVDFGRLRSLQSVIFFAYMNAKYQPHLFSLDYERSLRAAFLEEELRRMTAEELPGDVKVYATFLVPMLVVIQTAPRSLGADVSAKLKRMRSQLPKRYRADLDELRFFLRLGGLPADPFS